MSISYSSRLTTRGLSFAVDAANPASLPPNTPVYNYFTAPESISQWIVDGAITASAASTAPNGTTTAVSIAAGTGNNRIYCFDNSTVLGNKVFSIHVKSVVGATLAISATGGMTGGTATVNLTNISVTGFSNTTTITPVGNGWYRISLLTTVSSASGNSTYWAITGPAGSMLIWGWQLELGTTASIYYPASTSAATLNTRWNDITGTSRPIANSELTAVEVFAWGAGGGAGGTGLNLFCYGGGGGFAQSTIPITPGVSYTVAVGSGGQLGTQGCVIGVGGVGGTNGTAFGAGGEGTQAGTLPCSGTGGGGGAASLFLNNTTILLAAGGGGGGGGTESPENGTGNGGSGGQNGTAGQGAGANGGTSGAQLTTIGQTGTVIAGDHSGSGGGGGGYLGGNAGLNPTVDGLSGGGGGGGSNFGTVTASGFNQIRANSSSSFLAAYSSYATGGSSGSAGGQGIVIIRYLGAPKATGGTITSVDGYTVHTFANTGASTFVVAPPAVDFRSYGTFQNNVTYDSRNSGALVFDNNTSYVAFPDLPSQTNSPLSVFAWVYLNATPVGTNGIWGHYGVGNNNIHYEINPTTTRLRLGDTNKADLPMIAIGSWQFVGFTSTGSSHSYYVNGVLSTTWAGTTGTILGSSGAVPSSHMIGRSDATRVWNGRIAHVAVYNAELTAAEIVNNYNALRGRYGV